MQKYFKKAVFAIIRPIFQQFQIISTSDIIQFSMYRVRDHDMTFIFTTDGQNAQAARCMSLYGKVAEITKEDLLDFAFYLGRGEMSYGGKKDRAMTHVTARTLNPDFSIRIFH